MQGCSTLNEGMVLFLPSAMYALCAGCVPFTQCFKEVPLLYSSFDVSDALDDYHKVQLSLFFPQLMFGLVVLLKLSLRN